MQNGSLLEKCCKTTGFGLTFRGYVYGLSCRFRFGSRFNFGFRFCVYSEACAAWLCSHAIDPRTSGRIDPRTSGRMDCDVIDVNSAPDESAEGSSYFHVHGSHLYVSVPWSFPSLCFGHLCSHVAVALA